MKKKEIYGFRKSKISKTLCGAILGSAILVAMSGQKVFADTNSEGTANTATGNPSTNYTEAQGSPTQEAQKSQEQTGQKDGGLPVDVSSAELDQAVNDAKAAGVTVQQDETLDKGVANSISETETKKEEIVADYHNQATTIQATIQDYNQKIADYNNQVTKITNENQAAKEQYEKDKAAYDADVARITAENEQLKANYQAALKQYQADLANVAKANADNEANYQAALTAYNKELARVQTANATTKANYEAALASYNTELNRIKAANAAAKATYDQAVADNNAANASIQAENAAIQARNAAAKADYDAKVAQYQTDLATYNTKLAKYTADKAAYEAEQAKIKAAIEEAERTKNQDGHLSVPSAQSLIFEKETNATLSVTTTGDHLKASAVDKAFSHTTQYASKAFQFDDLNVTYLEQADSIASSQETLGNIGDKDDWTTNVNGKEKVKWSSVLLDRNETATATYTNLEHSYYMGKKISKIVYKYSIDPTSAYKNDKVWLAMFTDPTLGVFASAYTGQNEETSLFIKTELTFYDEDGNPINFDGALLSIASLNREANSIEMAKDYTGTFIKISGSSISEKNGMMYAVDTENFKEGEGGSRFTLYTRRGVPGWDTAGATNSWYGAGVLKTSGENIQITIGTTSSVKVLDQPEASDPRRTQKLALKKPNIWFTIDGRIRANNVPKVTLSEPTPPTAPTAPVAPTYETEKPLIPAPIEPTYEKEPTPPAPPTYEAEPTPPTRTPDLPTPNEPPTPNYTPLPTPPTVPTDKSLPTAPVAPTIHFHYARLFSRPQVNKEIKNNENITIDQGLVAKQSLVKFELKTDSLPAGRQKTTEFVLTDPLPSGYQLDLEATKTASPAFTVEYNEASHTITFKATDPTLKQYNTDLTKVVDTLFPTIIGHVLNDGATYKNNFTLSINNNYHVKSNIVRVTTPGKPNDPDNPNNNYIKPTKVNKNEQGVVIDGKSVLAGSTNIYELTWDLDQYTNIKVAPDTIQNGFYYVDDYPEEAVTLHTDRIKITDTHGNDVTGISIHQYDSLEAAPEKIRQILQKANISVKGAFQIFVADNPVDFYNKYVITGQSLTITDPMTVKSEMGHSGGTYSNKAYQIDFGNGYATDLVVNNVPKIDPKKDVSITLDPTDSENLDGKSIALNQIFTYRLIGGFIPANHSEALSDYSFLDNYNKEGDQYTGTYKVFAKVDTKLKDGTVIKAGTDLTTYTESYFDANQALVVVRFKEDFLRSLDNDAPFQAETYIQMKRIAVGTFENTYINTVNNVLYASNTVKTKTDLPKKENPSTVPVRYHKTPLNRERSLPETGVNDTAYMPYLGSFIALIAFGLLKVKTKKELS